MHIALASWNNETRKDLDLYLMHIHLREYDSNDTSTTEKSRRKGTSPAALIVNMQPRGSAGKRVDKPAATCHVYVGSDG
jgi:hypothetical protein